MVHYKCALFALAIAAGACLHISNAEAQDYVNGYARQDGTQVPGYERTAPDNTQTNNYSYQGNVNPYTGQVGTENDSQRNGSSYSGSRSNTGF